MNSDLTARKEIEQAIDDCLFNSLTYKRGLGHAATRAIAVVTRRLRAAAERERAGGHVAGAQAIEQVARELEG